MAGFITEVSSEFKVDPLGTRGVNALVQGIGCDWFHPDTDRVVRALSAPAFLSAHADVGYLFYYLLVETDAPVDSVLAELYQRELMLSGPFELLLFRAAHPNTPASLSLTTLDNAAFSSDPVLAKWFLTMHYCPMGYVVGGIGWGAPGYRLAFQPRFGHLSRTQAILVHRPVRP